MVSLLILVIITLLSASAMKSTILEEKMAGNYRNSNLSHQAAEAALREAEAYLTNTATTVLNPIFTPAGVTPGFYSIIPGNGPRWDTITANDAWATAATIVYGSGLGGFPSAPLTGIVAQPRYIIELVVCNPAAAGVPGLCYYRITARGVGNTATAVTMLQSVFQK